MDVVIQAGILVFPDVEELDFVGPFETLLAANVVKPGSMDVKILAFQDGPIRAANGLRFLPDGGPDLCPQLDVLILPGGQGRRIAVRDKRVINFVKERYEQVRFLGTVCTGAFIAAEAGLLEGRAATTHHGFFDELDAYPGVKVMEKKVVKDGRILTAGGVSSGIDLSLWILALLFDRDFAAEAAGYIEYPFRPDVFFEK
ncbi:MAG TPA: DJ-1/PfpI family protein [Aminivibrio sp.]|uniref:DJ-1/PfpI family protein n=1 Tax=Aminivibrio sp. TaxID=1872489 RepID=UPI002D0CB3F1|nr:DJ-1/PfpI family protein [Aminivibrio sp.]HPF85026.1 DJ-1/PfpI family protein [Aminivibrio sp.]